MLTVSQEGHNASGYQERLFRMLRHSVTGHLKSNRIEKKTRRRINYSVDEDADDTKDEIEPSK